MIAGLPRLLSVRRCGVRRQTTSGFTLIEVLLAVALTGLLLGGLVLVLNHLQVGASMFRGDGFAGQFERASGLIARDVRGLIEAKPLPQNTQSEHGEPIAAFRTTSRIDSIRDGIWLGVADVAYWVQEDAEGGQSLWRSEPGPDGEEVNWTRLMSGIESVELKCRIDGEWQFWPQQTEEQEADPVDSPLRPVALRLTLARLGDQWDVTQRQVPVVFRSFRPDMEATP